MEDFSLCVKQICSHLLAACLWVLRIFENLYFASTERVAIGQQAIGSCGAACEYGLQIKATWIAYEYILFTLAWNNFLTKII